jgi:hypothetical protein
MNIINSFDITNLEQRQVITPLGIGDLKDVDDKNNPTMAIVAIDEGGKLKARRLFDIKDLQEVEK